VPLTMFVIGRAVIKSLTIPLFRIA
jgi:hypothetical protein